MSRSRPQENRSPNPAARWFEWAGGKDGGVLTYYDKDAEQNVTVGLPFRFIVLDQLGAVGGWHKTSDCRISSNQVKNTRQQPLVVRTKKDGIIAEGLYQSIKERIAAVDGHFVANLYIAFKDGDDLKIGVLQVKASALKAWSDFKGRNEDAINSQAVEIVSFEEDKKGSITYRTPVFALRELSEKTNALAVALDAKLQTWLEGYFVRSREREQYQDAQPRHDAASGHDDTPHDPGAPPDDYGPGITDDDIPF